MLLACSESCEYGIRGSLLHTQLSVTSTPFLFVFHRQPQTLSHIHLERALSRTTSITPFVPLPPRPSSIIVWTCIIVAYCVHRKQTLPAACTLQTDLSRNANYKNDRLWTGSILYLCHVTTPNNMFVYNCNKPWIDTAYIIIIPPLTLVIIVFFTK